MQKWKMMVIILVSLLFLSGLWSCRTPAGRTAGQVLDDSSITTIVKAKIFNDPYLSGFAVSVDTFEGQVTLTGAVDSEYARQRAGDLAGSVDPVKKVNNLLTVKQ